MAISLEKYQSLSGGHSSDKVYITLLKKGEGSKVFSKDLSIWQSQLTQLKTEDIISAKPEILREFESLYGQLYTTQKPANDKANEPRAKLTRHRTEDIPDVSLYEISVALKQLKNNKAPGDDGIATELLRAGGKPILKVLQKLINSLRPGLARLTSGSL